MARQLCSVAYIKHRFLSDGSHSVRFLLPCNGCPKKETREVRLTTEQKAFVQLSNFVLISIGNTLT